VRYTCGGIRENILRMSNTTSNLKPMDMGLKVEFLVHLIFASLPKKYETFVVNYNLQPDKWNIEKLIAICVQEEERLKSSQGDSVNHVKENKKKNFNNKNAKPQRKPQWDNSSFSKPQGKTTQTNHHKKFNNVQIDKDTCKWCKRKGHYQKECLEFLKHLMRKCEDVITFIDESLYLSYAKSTWWIDSGATIHVANSLQRFHTRILQRRERHIKVANGVKVEVKAIGELPLELNDDFVLKLIDVLYVPSLHRNLISV
jgi:uncharacterized protein (DUF4415 family)